MQHLHSITLLALCFTLNACSISPTESAADDKKTATSSTSSMTLSQEQYFQTLLSLCGQKFVGQSSFPTDPDDSFYGKRLVANFKSCSDDEIRVPFIVGDDHSRTWIFTRMNDGLQLKHDHRHHDGTPDEVTNYGGIANDKGLPSSQFFPADEFTANLLPAAATNVWNISLSEDGQELTYYLERHSKPRFKATLTKVK